MKKEAAVFHIPHASVVIPDEYLRDFSGDTAENLRTMTDRYTDELFNVGYGSRLVFPVSRLVCDPERFREDEAEEMAKIGMGAVYTNGFDLRPIRAVSPERREEILRTFYDPHHRALEAVTAQHLSRFGQCLIVDCHSFSAVPLPYERRPEKPGVCIGTDAFHTPAWLPERLADGFRRAGFEVLIDRPFAGTMVPLSRYGKDPDVLSVMIELNRGLYMTETGAKRETFSALSRTVRECIGTLFEE